MQKHNWRVHLRTYAVLKVGVGLSSPVHAPGGMSAGEECCTMRRGNTIPESLGM